MATERNILYIAVCKILKSKGQNKIPTLSAANAVQLTKWVGELATDYPPHVFPVQAADDCPSQQGTKAFHIRFSSHGKSAV